MHERDEQRLTDLMNSIDAMVTLRCTALQRPLEPHELKHYEMHKEAAKEHLRGLLSPFVIE